jgi:signal transduction histidine kinase
MSYIIFAETYFYAIRKKENKKGFLFPKIIKNIKSTYQPVLEYLLICICYLVIIIFFDGFGYVSYASEIYVIIVWIYTMVLLNELNFRTQIYEITKQVEMMRKGNMNVSIKCTNSELEELGENINHLKQGMEKAINESIKAERLKTDLITNVSHDLKTPLTSIINYTDLLKKEKIENENAKKYIDILEKKSKKLKILTEDLIEVSKISSGNETVALEKIDFKELVLQANGEFAEKFEEKNLEVISNLPKEAVIVDLDGKKMWRVLENLYQNVYKYSLENTRVYVDLIVNDHIVFTIKNISKEKLNISPDELMERFIRGDSSRHTGGNGLGLSIAKDLSKLNGGTLSIQIDGDLFVAKIKLDNIKLL